MKRLCRPSLKRPFGRKYVVCSTIDELYYLLNNADVLSTVDAGDFDDALEHFAVFGGRNLEHRTSIFRLAII